MHSRILILALLLLLAAASPACAYGRSVEDLVGSFSIGKTIKIGSSSECFSSAGAADPLAPPQIGANGPLADDQAPSLAGFAFQPQQLSAASPQPVNLTAHLIDDQAVWAAQAAFSGPLGQSAFAIFTAENRTAGTEKDGIYAAAMLLPARQCHRRVASAESNPGGQGRQSPGPGRRGLAGPGPAHRDKGDLAQARQIHCRFS